MAGTFIGRLFSITIVFVTISGVQSDREDDYGDYMCSLTPPLLSTRCSRDDQCTPKSLLACSNGRCCARNMVALGILQKSLEVLRCRKFKMRNPCKPNPCPANATCFIKKTKTKSKAVCIQDDPCLTTDCGENGECFSGNNNGTNFSRCICQPGFCGDTCTASTEATGDPCLDGVCVVPASVCVNGQCVCNCGDVYIAETVPGGFQSRRVCRAGCQNGLSNSFRDFPAAQLTSDNAFPIANIPSLEACKNACIASTAFECVSIEYFATTSVCFLNRVRKDDPTSFKEEPSVPALSYSERLCN